MSQPNGLNPTVQGNMTANGFSTPSGAQMIKQVYLNGPLEVNIFGATNGFAGSIMGVKVISANSTARVITFKGAHATASTLLRISATSLGYVQGTNFAYTFASGGTLTAVSDAATDTSIIEVCFSAT